MIPPGLADVVARARGLSSTLVEPEHADAKRVLALAAEVLARPEDGPESEANVALRIELRGLGERLARRRAEAIPFAGLARALSATLHGSRNDAVRIVQDCDRELAMLGY